MRKEQIWAIFFQIFFNRKNEAGKTIIKSNYSLNAFLGIDFISAGSSVVVLII